MSDGARFDEALRGLVEEFSRRLVTMFYQEMQQHFQKFSPSSLVDRSLLGAPAAAAAPAAPVVVTEAPKKRGRAKAAKAEEAKAEPIVEAVAVVEAKPAQGKTAKAEPAKPEKAEKPSREKKAKAEAPVEIVVAEVLEKNKGRAAKKAEAAEMPAAEEKVDKRTLPRYCMLPGCTELAAGPRYGWFCRNHASSLSEEEKQAAREARTTVAKPAPTELVVVEAAVEEEPSSVRTPVRRNKVNPEEIKRLRKAGKTHEQIAAKLKISKGTVARYASKLS